MLSAEAQRKRHKGKEGKRGNWRSGRPGDLVGQGFIPGNKAAESMGFSP
jgi:hypothetical protein